MISVEEIAPATEIVEQEPEESAENRELGAAPAESSEPPPERPPEPEPVVEEEEPPQKKRGRPKAAPKEKPAPKPKGRPRKVQVVEDTEWPAGQEVPPVYVPPTEEQLREYVTPLLRAYATHLHLRGRDAKRARYRSLFSRVA